MSYTIGPNSREPWPHARGVRLGERHEHGGSAAGELRCALRDVEVVVRPRDAQAPRTRGVDGVAKRDVEAVVAKVRLQRRVRPPVVARLVKPVLRVCRFVSEAREFRF